VVKCDVIGCCLPAQWAVPISRHLCDRHFEYVWPRLRGEFLLAAKRVGQEKLVELFGDDDRDLSDIPESAIVTLQSLG